MSQKESIKKVVEGLTEAALKQFDLIPDDVVGIQIKRSDISATSMENSTYEQKETKRVKRWKRLELHVEIDWDFEIEPI